MMTVMGSISQLEETELSLTSLLMCLMAYRSWELINCQWTSRHLLILIQRTLVLPFRPGKTMPILYVFLKNVLTLFVWIRMVYMILLCPLCIDSFCVDLNALYGSSLPTMYWFFLCESECFIWFFFAHYVLFHPVNTSIFTSMGSFQIEKLQKFYPTFSLRFFAWWLLTQLYVLVARNHDSGCQHRLNSTVLIDNVKAKHKSVQHLK